LYYIVNSVDCEVNLCDFHREQAWERWASATKHGASDAAVKDELLARLRHIASAPNIAAYHAAVSELKGSTVWTTNIALQRWFTKTWLREHKVSILSVDTFLF
jgi:esterase/lipase superfamily enzyme